MSGAVDFKERISRQRPHDRETYEHAGDTDLQDIVYQLESDRGRIVNSAAVRRLQQKTQAPPLERNAAVRSRLTYPLEVQQTGCFIVRTLFRQLGLCAAEVDLDGLEGVLESLMEMACLMHDVDNPPLGHPGEYAISDWFERDLDAPFERRIPPGQGDGLLQQRMLIDLKYFRGNTQAIRLVVKLLRLNLTYTQTAGLLKYVRPAYGSRPDKAATNHYLNKKPGFHLSGGAFVDELHRVLGMCPGIRRPVVYIMEAVDDISYCLVDTKDSAEKDILDIRQLADLLMKKLAVHHSPNASILGDADNMSSQWIVDYSLEKAKRESINKISEFFIRLWVKMIHPPVQHAAQQFIDNLEVVYAGTLGRALTEDGSLSHAIVQTFKDVAMEWMFCHPEVETLGLRGYRIIQGLLDSYAPLPRLSAEEFQALAKGRQAAAPHPQLLVRCPPSQQIKAYPEAMKGVAEDPLQWQREFYRRCRTLQDSVSGMTDQYAQDEYRALPAL